MHSVENKSKERNIISWLFFILFVAIGILNIIFVHLVPGIFYLLISVLYLPRTNSYLNRKLGFSIPLAVKIILGFVILWATLAVGDLMEMFESWIGV